MAVFFGVFGGLLIVGGLALALGGLLGGVDGAVSAVLFGLFMVAVGVGALVLMPKLKRMGQLAKLGLGKTAGGAPPLSGVGEVLSVGKRGPVMVRGRAVKWYIAYELRVTLAGRSPYDTQVVEPFTSPDAGEVAVGTPLRVHVDPDDPTLIALARAPGNSNELVVEQPGSLRSLFEPES